MEQATAARPCETSRASTRKRDTLTASVDDTGVRGPLLAAYRRSGLTQAQIAARAEVSARTVASVLHGQNVRLHSLAAVCVVLGCRLVLDDEKSPAA